MSHGAPPKYKRSYMDPRTVPLSPKLQNVLRDPAPDPEQALLQTASEDSSHGLHLKFSALRPVDHLVVELWLSGLSQSEIAHFLGASQQRMDFRLSRAMKRLRAAGITTRPETI